MTGTAQSARTNFVVRFLPATLVLAATFAAVARPAGAVSMCGDRNFGGTIVHECYDAADSYVTFTLDI
jgi:hypothetical protein